ncbi:hypothetical protein [Streptomyces longispororuber]|uniref:hypothetical protein n=1 Tax=Streptomyces longispororuber TaxID=68230 RepID=UPI00210BAD6E|nr:hypothetical protein [Streptomyces longispororuber]MCQ4208959.1 hypothetical protein [Streptomyces longispororuber]
MVTEIHGLIECRPGARLQPVGGGTRTRAQVAGDATHWGPAWSVMRLLSELHGAANVRLVVWFV